MTTVALTAEHVRRWMRGGLDTLEIAKLFGIRESTVWNALARGEVLIACRSAEDHARISRGH